MLLKLKHQLRHGFVQFVHDVNIGIQPEKLKVAPLLISSVGSASLCFLFSQPLTRKEVTREKY